MHTVELAYPPSVEQQHYMQTQMTWGDDVVSIQGVTIAGNPDKPNEDTFAVGLRNESVVAAVFDGTSSLRPIPALHPRTGAHFASNFLKDTVLEVAQTREPHEILLALNRKLLQQTIELGGSLEDTHSLPASTATIVELSKTDEVVSFGHVADSFGIAFYDDGQSQVFTNDTNRKFDERTLALLTDIARTDGITHREAAADERIKAALIASFIEKNNNPNGMGSGIVNGSPHIEKYVQKGRLSLRGVRAILLGTDGLLPPGWSTTDSHSRSQLYDVITNGGFEELIAIKHFVEDSDPDWQNPRFKHSDDATGLLIELPG